MVALIFIMVVGLLISVALSKTGTVLKSDLSVRNDTQLQYAADAGIERALQVLRSDVSSNSPAKFCPDSGAGTVQMTNPANPNAQDSGGYGIETDLSDQAKPQGSLMVNYSCQTLVGSVPTPGSLLTNNFAVVTTGGKATKATDETITSSQAVGSTLDIDGAVYVAGPEQDADLQKQISLTGGDLVEFDGGDFNACTKDVQAVTSGKSPSFTVDSAGGFSATCGAQTPAEAIPASTLPPAPATAPNSIDFPIGATGKAVTCRIFWPGKYTSANAPVLLDSPDKNDDPSNYFVSGEYYFDNVAITIDKGAVVFGGQPNTGDLTAGDAMSATGCSAFAGLTDTALKTLLATMPGMNPLPANVWDHGTEWVMGGSSTLDLKAGSLSLYSPTPSDSSEPPVSLLAARSDQWFTSDETTDSANNYDPWNDPGELLLDVQSANNVHMTSNGKILAPDAPMSVTGTEKSIAVARAGIVASALDLNASAAVQAGSFSFQACCGGTITENAAQRRTVEVTARVVARDGASLTESAVATIDNFGDRPIRVYSWHVT